MKFGHDKLPTFGVGKEYGEQEWRSIFRQLNGAGVITLDVTGYGTWSVSEAGRRVLKGSDKITLRKDTLKSGARKTARSSRQCRSAGRRRRRAIRNCSRRCASAALSLPRNSASPPMSSSPTRR